MIQKWERNECGRQVHALGSDPLNPFWRCSKCGALYWVEPLYQVIQVPDEDD